MHLLFSSQSWPTLCDCMNCSTLGFPVLHCLPEFSCPLSQWCHPTISSSVVPFSSIFPSIRVFSNESALHIRWPKYWSFSFSISPSYEYSGLISFRMDSPCRTRDSQESSPTPQFKSINSSLLSLLYGPTLTSICEKPYLWLYSPSSSKWCLWFLICYLGLP